ncbi:MAG: hypothetical protein QM758_05490 [Armatimonas sp.]
MTPEQNEQWRQAINPLDYLDFHAISYEGVEESTARLRELGAPGWTTRTRFTLLTSVPKSPALPDCSLLFPEFALRSEVALVGLQLLYPDQAEAAVVYQRILKLFLHNALLPLAVLPEIERFCQLCANPNSTRQEWEALGAEKTSFSKLYYRHEDWWGAAKIHEGACWFLYYQQEDGWEATHHDFGAMLLLVYGKPLELMWRDFLSKQREGIPIHSLTTHFLNALETECPPPDWLPLL